MGFTQIEFVLFFGLLLAIVWLLSSVTRSVVVRNVLLLVASYYFYAYWDYRFCGLLVLSTVIDFTAAKRIDASSCRQTRRFWLTLSVAVNLSVLGFFKYFNFFVGSLAPVVESLGWSASTLSIILPVGISFYTFQTLSYTIDVFRRRLTPTRRFLDFALYVAFFPQLVAGPIVRARELLPQLGVLPPFSKRRFYGGAQQLLRGAVKKVLIADRLGEMVDVVFAGTELYSGLTIAIAVIAYAGQIYYDFSGYSDMAIGTAKMLGYRFPVNFRHPYLSTSPAEFWHRWHMTLSRWLRDYLYIPLGGSKHGEVATYRNLMLTMTLGGLWHGAAWTFVFWGIWHGAVLAAGRWFGPPNNRSGPRERTTDLSRTRSSRAVLPGYSVILGWSVTMAAVMVGWVLFRSESLTQAFAIMGRMCTAADGIHWFPPLAIAAIFIAIVDHLAWSTRLRRAMRLPFDSWYAPVATAVMIMALLLYAPRGFTPFVYFQF